MGAPQAEVKCCPKCKRLVEAKDYMNPAILGLMESVLPKIYCRCGYRGLPIEMSKSDYEKWLKSG
ncbi:MAG: hypothetical protein AB1295_04155 [Candidatus Micrarchaeota archaeon]